MALYTYQGYNPSGEVEDGTIEATGERIAYETLQSRDITVIELTQGRKSSAHVLPWYRRDISLRGNELPFDDQANTASLLATLFSAGISAADVIRIAVLSSEKPSVKRHFERVGQRVADGETFSSAFEKENRIFSPIFSAFLKVSDTANTLATVLEELSKFLRRQNEIRQKIISALIYPAILVVAAVLLCLTVVLYLAPNLEPIFNSAQQTPPATLTTLLHINDFLVEYWIVITLTTLTAFGSGLALLQTPKTRVSLYQVSFRVPMIGRLMMLSTLSRLAQSTALLISSGHSFAAALRLSSDIMGRGTHLGDRFKEASETIESGGSASSVFTEDKYIPPQFKELFRIAEETNRVPSTLMAISTSLSTEVDRQSQRLLSLMTPMLTLILGLGIGFLIYTLMGAILEVNELAF